MADLLSLAGKLDIDYHSYNRSLLDEFYIPCLKQSVRYDRAVAYFTSEGLSMAAQGVAHLLQNGGRINLVCSPQLSTEDIAALRKGYTDRKSLLKQALQIKFEDIMSELVHERLNALAWLIADGKLDVKLAIPNFQDDSPQYGIYHQKIGIFTDANGNAIAFSGSSNETRGGLLHNFESIDVFTSWEDERRVKRKSRDFTALWNNQMAGLEIFDFTEATDEILARYKKGTRPTNDPAEREPETAKPAPQAKWRHQEEAIEIFLQRERGILNMATGTGKTRTALRIVKRLAEEGKVESVIVCTYGNDLLDQWYKEILKALPSGFVVHRHFEGHREREKFSANPIRKILLVSRSELAPALKRLSIDNGAKTIVVQDEVHRMGSEANLRDLAGLSNKIRFRLGLSATPTREYDPVGTDFIFSEVGPIIFEFTLEDAIRRGILAPFDYFPLEYEPTQEDRNRIQALLARASAKKAEGDPIPDEQLWQELAKVYKSSKAKLPVFRDFLEERPYILNRCIIFVFSKEYGEEVYEIVHEIHPSFHTYYAEDEKETLVKFGRGELECLITCKKLSEGIDIRSLRNVVLFASDRAPLETIQRIGRCIRSDPDNPEKVAAVVDFIRTSNEDSGAPNADEERRDFLQMLSSVRPEAYVGPTN